MVYYRGRMNGNILIMMNDIKASGRTTNHRVTVFTSERMAKNMKENTNKEGEMVKEL